ncbi:MAG: Flagellar basal-body rod protein FlgG [Verrucomicrobiota bacterium]|jgi:flagellar basal-body rod protein FlgG
MNVGLYQAASALNANSRWQELISENLAASSVPGFKKQELSFSAIQAGLLPAASAPDQRFLLPQSAAAVNFKAGELKFTGSKTDVALEGAGFLAVQLPEGATAYTRDGELRLSPAGQLTTKQGFPVLGDNGPIQVDVNNPAPVTISAQGEVSQGAEVRGRLRAVEFDRPQLLTPIGRGQFLANNPELQPAESAATTFHQGYVETANTSPAMEMANLITSMRLYEANQRVIRAQDDRMSRAITELSAA